MVRVDSMSDDPSGGDVSQLKPCAWAGQSGHPPLSLLRLASMIKRKAAG